MPLVLLSLSLTRCALTDHYELTSAPSGVSGTGSFSSGGISADAGGDATLAGFSGTSGVLSAGGLDAAGGTVGSAGSSQDGTCSSPCSELEECCAGTCVEITTDAQNCGGCGKACDVGRCAAGACRTGWVSMAPPPTGFVGRIHPATVAMGSSVFIWGGRGTAGGLDTGAIYSPATDSWVLVNQTGAPPPRSLATAVWTGSVVIVSGGVDDSNNNLLRDAYAYDPNAKTWTTLPPPATHRCRTLGLWDGTHAIFWGGTDQNNVALAGADRFDLTNWTTSSTPGDPGPLLGPAVGFDGSTLYLQGGLLNSNARQDKVFSYATATDKWTPVNKGPTVRSSGFGTWDGAHFVIWGGRDDANVRNDGKYLSGSTWTDINATGAPSARMLFWLRAGWAFAVRPGVVAILGGQTQLAGNGIFSTNGATFDVAANEWKAIADWPSGETHDYGVGVWTGEEFVLWSGYDQVAAAGQQGNTSIAGERLSF
ncbi:MAG TPA: hypothetical protein VHW01_23125 [Polyangiaceae bacterium]|nr:hypothetical protein [Polyangiaceae bacterium]